MPLPHHLPHHPQLLPNLPPPALKRLFRLGFVLLRLVQHGPCGFQRLFNLPDLRVERRGVRRVAGGVGAQGEFVLLVDCEGLVVAD